MQLLYAVLAGYLLSDLPFGTTCICTMNTVVYKGVPTRKLKKISKITSYFLLCIFIRVLYSATELPFGAHCCIMLYTVLYKRAPTRKLIIKVGE